MFMLKIAPLFALCVAFALSSAVNGSDENVVQGQRGYPGHPGPQGVRGHKGEKGATGATGDRGQKGEQGMTGSPGSQGKEGPAGVVGPPGPSCVGSPGPQGPRGSTGVQGHRGPQGTKGIKGDAGFKGERGLIGPRGTEGDDGNPGPPGHPGNGGPKGDKGDRGLPGYKGQPGPQGVPGPELSEDILRKYFEPFKALEAQYKKLDLSVQSLQADKRKLQEEVNTLRLNYSSSSDRPAAHLYGNYGGYLSESQTITQWATSTNGNYQSFLRGGMAYSNGYITVPQDGLYYIYAQMHFHASSTGTAIYFYIRINDNDVVRQYSSDHSSGQPHEEDTGFMRFLVRGDRVSVYAAGNKYYVHAPHGFIGAYKL